MTHPLFENYKDPYGPENDYFRAWTKDSDSRDCRVGLTFEETKEYDQLARDWVIERLTPMRSVKSRAEAERAVDRHIELDDKHQIARHARLADPADREARLTEFMERQQK